MKEPTRIRSIRGSVGDLVHGPAVTVEARSSLRSVAVALGDLGIGMVVVLEEGRIAGVVSERDLIWAIAREADLDAVWAADVMTPSTEIVSVSPETDVGTAAEAMTVNNARHLLVDYPAGPGVVSIRDVVQHLIAH